MPLIIQNHCSSQSQYVSNTSHLESPPVSIYFEAVLKALRDFCLCIIIEIETSNGSFLEE